MAYVKPSLEQYRKAATNSATPLGLVIMLYDGALRFMREGKSAMEVKDYYVQNEKLTKAQRIVTELTITLDMDKGGQIAQNLFTLYDFVYDRLVQANLHDRLDYVDQAMKVMSDLRETWVELELRGKSSQPAAVQHAA